MTRKEFLATVAAAAVTPTLATSSAAAKPQPKLSASSYSYNGDFQLGTMDLEDVIIDLADMGATAIEVIAQGPIVGYPDPPAQWVKQWFGWLDKYGIKAGCLDASQDIKLYLHRELTVQEMADQVILNLQLAKKLGFTLIRTYGNSWPTAIGKPDANGWDPRGAVPDSWPWGKAGINHFDVLSKCLATAEKLDVKICEELHTPFLFKSEYMERTMEFIAKTKSKHYGLKPDMSIFRRTDSLAGSPAWIQNLVDKGARRNIVEYIVKNFESGASAEETRAGVVKMGGNDLEVRTASASGVFHGDYNINRRNDPKELTQYMPYVYDTHCKFRSVSEDLREATIPYEEIIPVMARAGYSGYLSSEYEGSRGPYEASQQIRRQHCMMRKLWAEA